MKKLNIVSDKKASLRRKSQPINFPLESYIIDLGKKMRNHLINSQDYDYIQKNPKVRPGVGLAAPQVGKNIRMFAVYFTDQIQIEDQIFETTYDYVLVNPEIIKRSETPTYLKGGEGCLSVNEEHCGYVIRNYEITITAYDLNTSSNVTLNLKGYPAIVFQHEYDHLDGILFYDRINHSNPFLEVENAIVIE